MWKGGLGVTDCGGPIGLSPPALVWSSVGTWSWSAGGQESTPGQRSSKTRDHRHRCDSHKQLSYSNVLTLVRLLVCHGYWSCPLLIFVN